MERKRLWLPIGLAAACAVATLLLLFLMRSSPSRSSEDRYAKGDLSGTLAALAEQQNELGSDRPDDNHDRLAAHFLSANCYRQLGLNREFQKEVDDMRMLPDAADQVNLALAMFKIQHGELNDSPRTLVDVLISAGAQEGDAWSVVIQGAFNANRLDEAQQMLDQWRARPAGTARAAPAQLEYLTAVSFNISGATEQAEAKLISTIEQHPQHELSWLALAELYSRPPNVRFRQSELVLERLAARFPHSPDVHVRLARVRRRLGAGEQSLSQLTSADTETELLEKANIEFDIGDYPQSVATLKTVGLSTADAFRRLTDAAFELSLNGQGEAGGELSQRVSFGATALALSGDRATARTVFEDAANRTARLRRLQDLANHQAAEPGRTAVTDAMNAVVSLSTPFLTQPLERFAYTVQPVASARGLELYQTLCADCHGRGGRGDGRAACNLFPPPRNFRDEPMRMISTENRVASDEDLARTIRRGEPGTSMPAFERLSDAEVAWLVEVVRQFIVEGLRDRYARQIAADGAEHDVQAEREWLAVRSEPSAALGIPDLNSTPSLVARGHKLFRTTGCANCHALASEPALAATALFDSLGRPVKAPRLDVDLFHGGDDASEIYARIALGIPGTPHPALVSTNAGDVESLVAFIRSIRSAAPAVLSNYQRSALLVDRNEGAEKSSALSAPPR